MFVLDSSDILMLNFFFKKITTAQLLNPAVAKLSDTARH
jgi:hypothetical protein